MNQQIMSPQLIPAPVGRTDSANMARHTQMQPTSEALPISIVASPSRESQPPARKVIALQDDFSDEAKEAAQVRQIDTELAEETEALRAMKDSAGQ